MGRLTELARAPVSSGLEKSGVTVKRYLFKEILSEEIRGKMCESGAPC